MADFMNAKKREKEHSKKMKKLSGSPKGTFKKFKLDNGARIEIFVPAEIKLELEKKASLAGDTLKTFLKRELENFAKGE